MEQEERVVHTVNGLRFLRPMRVVPCAACHASPACVRCVTCVSSVRTVHFIVETTWLSISSLICMSPSKCSYIQHVLSTKHDDPIYYDLYVTNLLSTLL